MNDELFNYNDKYVFIVFHTDTQEPYFHLEQICEMLNYSLNDDIIYQNNKNILNIKYIVKNYKYLLNKLDKNMKFINKNGLYDLINNSSLKNLNDIKILLNNKIMPKITKYIEYKLNHKYKNIINKLQLELHKMQLDDFNYYDISDSDDLSDEKLSYIINKLKYFELKYDLLYMY